MQIDVALDVIVTVKPLEAENVSAWFASPTVMAEGVLKVIV